MNHFIVDLLVGSEASSSFSCVFCFRPKFLLLADYFFTAFKLVHQFFSPRGWLSCYLLHRLFVCVTVCHYSILVYDYAINALFILTFELISEIQYFFFSRHDITPTIKHCKIKRVITNESNLTAKSY